MSDTVITPLSTSEVAAELRAAASSQKPICVVGGETSLGLDTDKFNAMTNLRTSGLNRIVDFPARDMTITLETGVTLAKLDEILAAERQWLPIDAADRETGTVGGLIASGFSGARRLGYGRIRDYVLGITAVDGRGVEFHAGGRVVKNVAGYDLCKLLTGSQGTLAAITQATLRTRPLPEVSRLLSGGGGDVATVATLLDHVAEKRLPLSGCELVVEAGSPRASLLLEGTEKEVAWTAQKISSHCPAWAWEETSGTAAATQWQQIVTLTKPRAACISLKLVTLPSQVYTVLSKVLAFDGSAQINAHALNGILYTHFESKDAAKFAKFLLSDLQPFLQTQGGHAQLLSASGLGEVPRSLRYGGQSGSAIWATRVKQQFDPHGILSPGIYFGGDA
jgi:glycolate oxidase FAD binding subunit